MKKRDIYLLSPTPEEGTIPLPMISFSLVTDKIDFDGCDILLFTSKQAVKSAEAIDTGWKKYPAVAIGPATKKQIETLGGSVIYHPSSFYGETLSQHIVTYFKDKKILYLRPQKVSFDTKGYLERAGIEVQEQVLYETSCADYPNEEAPSKGAVIIFTSPSTVNCFFQNFEWDQSYTAVLIGEATKKYLKPDMNYVVADEPLIQSCIEKANSLVE
ncbi:uroporphyrinogen-III synthase [Sulfurovum sp. zt1-1]|uniref:Uroporphyrinogen-III synthase n=1 Tax=Sulfurovum zhangzhouensis TaxID=3019067 RepID=A0ABT7QWK3_9BACT|nr:uroporphyrinogen-III synthase [Sulfurovum zhangzhouensis]MDM5271217.1 uroporphyrinogen-III synthase [Sulfurovum zhangzhouensis]